MSKIPEPQVRMSLEPLIAVFVDFENLAIGVRDMGVGTFQIQLVLKRLLEKGRIVYKCAYCDWTHYKDELQDFHGQGIELIDIPQRRMTGKNSADIRMVVDALDLCYSKDHIDISAAVGRQRLFTAGLEAQRKQQAGHRLRREKLDLGPADGQLRRVPVLRRSDPRRQAGQGRSLRKGKPEEDKKQEATDRVLAVLQSVEQDYDPLWGSLLKQTIRRVYPGFSESYYGYGSFSDLLEDIKSKGLIELEYDESRGNYKVRQRKA